jgi:hypothetical protein
MWNRFGPRNKLFPPPQEQIAPPNKATLRVVKTQNAFQLSSELTPPEKAKTVETPKTEPSPRVAAAPQAAPWKAQDVEDSEVEQMQVHLATIAETFHRSSLGPHNRTTARDIMGAAKLSKPDATPDEVSKFIAWKFRERRPYPYESRGLRTFGGVLPVVAAEFGSWMQSDAQEVSCPWCGNTRQDKTGLCTGCCRRPVVAAQCAAQRDSREASNGSKCKLT